MNFNTATESLTYKNEWDDMEDETCNAGTPGCWVSHKGAMPCESY